MSSSLSIPAMRPAAEQTPSGPSATTPDSATLARADHQLGGGVVDGPGLPELHFVHPLPGFPDLTRFALVRLGEPADGGGATADGEGATAGADGEDAEEAGPSIFELRSVENPDVRFLVATPEAFFPEYDVELDDASAADLGLTDARDALVLVVLTIGADAASTTANLLAPVVVNVRTRSAAQVILSGTDWPVRAAVV